MLNIKNCEILVEHSLEHLEKFLNTSLTDVNVTTNLNRLSDEAIEC